MKAILSLVIGCFIEKLLFVFPFKDFSGDVVMKYHPGLKRETEHAFVREEKQNIYDWARDVVDDREVGLTVGGHNRGRLGVVYEGKQDCHLINLDNNFYLLLEGSARHPNIHHVEANGSNIPLKNNSVDFTLCSEVIEHNFYPERIIDEISRVLKPGGHFILTTPAANLLRRIFYRSRYMITGDPSNLWEVRSSYRSPERLREDYDDISDGHIYEGFALSTLVNWLRDRNFRVLKTRYFPVRKLNKLLSREPIIKWAVNLVPKLDPFKRCLVGGIQILARKIEGSKFKDSSVGFPDKWTELLKCSSCNGDLNASGDVLECKNCSTQFPVTDQVVRFIG